MSSRSHNAGKLRQARKDNYCHKTKTKKKTSTIVNMMSGLNEIFPGTTTNKPQVELYTKSLRTQLVNSINDGLIVQVNLLLEQIEHPNFDYLVYLAAEKNDEMGRLFIDKALSKSVVLNWNRLLNCALKSVSTSVGFLSYLATDHEIYWPDKLTQAAVSDRQDHVDFVLEHGHDLKYVSCPSQVNGIAVTKMVFKLIKEHKKKLPLHGAMVNAASHGSTENLEYFMNIFNRAVVRKIARLPDHKIKMDFDHAKNAAFVAGCSHGHLHIVIYFMSQCDVHLDYLNGLIGAAHHGHFLIVIHLNKYLAEMSEAQIKTMAINAGLSGNCDLINYLLDGGICCYNDYMIGAIANGHVKAFKTIIDRGRGLLNIHTCFLCAASYGRLEFIKDLVNYKHEFHATEIIIASVMPHERAHDDVEFVQAILWYKRPIDISNLLEIPQLVKCPSIRQCLINYQSEINVDEGV